MARDGVLPLSSRRRFFIQALQGIGLSSLGALLWGAFINEAKSSPLLLRPPGAVDEADFMSLCIRCGLCVEACPYDTLRLAQVGDQVALGTPFFTPRDTPCYLCKDVPCVPVCPSGALDKSLVSKFIDTGKSELDVRKAKMGVAVVDADQCIAFWGVQCDACYRACPLINEAIVIDQSRNDRTGKHALMVPRVVGDVCTGCGLCEKACVTEKASIFVLPLAVAKGKAGSHYIKGWDDDDERRLNHPNVGGVLTHTPTSDKKPIDYLNGDGL